jgi:hypothetical protein
MQDQSQPEAADNRMAMEASLTSSFDGYDVSSSSSDNNRHFWMWRSNTSTSSSTLVQEVEVEESFDEETNTNRPRQRQRQQRLRRRSTSEYYASTLTVRIRRLILRPFTILLFGYCFLQALEHHQRLGYVLGTNSNSNNNNNNNSTWSANYVGSAWTTSSNSNSNSNMWWHALLQPKQYIPNYPAVVWPKYYSRNEDDTVPTTTPSLPSRRGNENENEN